MQETNCCIRCGQPLNMLDDTWAEDKSTSWKSKGEYCPRCYLELVELEHQY